MRLSVEGTAVYVSRISMRKGELGVKTAVGPCRGWIRWSSSLCVNSFGAASCWPLPRVFRRNVEPCETGRSSSFTRTTRWGSVLTWDLGWGCLMCPLDAKRNQEELLQPGKGAKFHQITDQFCYFCLDPIFFCSSSHFKS